LDRDFTFFVWIKSQASTAYPRIIHKSNGSTGLGYGVALETSNRIIFSRFKSNGTGNGHKYFAAEGLKENNGSMLL